MEGRSMDVDWQADLEHWLQPFLAGLSHPARRRMCPLYIAGLIGPGDRKSVQPMAARAGDVGYDQLHHFVAAGVWDSAPLEAALLKEADRLVGDEAGFLVIDDTALPKKGQHSVGVAPQYASSLGKTSNCQSLVSVTLASREVPVMVGLRLFLPDTWTNDPERMMRARVPKDRQVALTKPEIASGVQRTLDDLGNLGIGDSSRSTRTIFICQPFNTILYEPAAPLANRVLVNTQAFGNVLALQALRAQKDHPASIRQGAWRFMPAHLRFQKTSIRVAQNDDVRLPPNHRSNSCSCDRSRTK